MHDRIDITGLNSDGGLPQFSTAPDPRAAISVLAAEGLELMLANLPKYVEMSRVRRGLNKTELARTLGVSREFLWRFNNGRSISTVTLHKIIKWLQEEVA